MALYFTREMADRRDLHVEVDSGGTLDPPTSQLDVEPFSSLGGNIPFYFDGSGNPLPGAPQTRFKQLKMNRSIPC